jgi:predicted Zn-dependent protease
VLRKYPEKDQTLPARYARAIVRYFASGTQGAANELDALIAEQPNNPYFHELKGQFLLESGKVKASIAPLRQAVSLNPKSGLIRIMLGQALISTDDPGVLKEAIDHLKKGLVQEDQSVIGYRQLAIAYGRLNRIAEAQLASAQSFLFEGNADFAKVHAERAMMGFPQGSPDWVKANDVISDVDTYRKLAKQ